MILKEKDIERNGIMLDQENILSWILRETLGPKETILRLFKVGYNRTQKQISTWGWQLYPLPHLAAPGWTRIEESSG